MHRLRFIRLVLALAATFTIASVLHAQTSVREREPITASLVAGAAQFDLSGTGTTAVIGVRGELNANRWLILQAGLTLFRPDEQFGQNSTYIAPELQVQAQVPGRILRPYVGVGVGTVVITDSRNAFRSVTGAGGMRVAIPKTHFDIRAELRVRGMGRSLTSVTAEWTLGSGIRF